MALPRSPLLVALTLAPSLATAKIVFSDNFQAGANAAWGNEAGHWRVAHAEYDATNPECACNGQGAGAYSSVTTFPNLTDFTVRVTVHMVSTATEDGGVWLRFSSGSAGINGIALVTGGNYVPAGQNPYPGLFFAKYVNGVETELNASGPIPNFLNNKAQLKIVVHGSTYSVYLNGATTPILTLTDSSFTTGRVALYDNSPQTFTGTGPS